MRKSVGPSSWRAFCRAAALALMLLLVPVSAALGMPVGGEKEGPAHSGLSPEDQKLIERRRQMREEYEEMREKRLEALKQAVRETSADPTGGQVPGWKPEATGAATAPGGGRARSGPASTGRTDPLAGAKERKEPEVSNLPPPGEKPDHTVLVVVGCGVLVALLLRVLFPTWFENGFFPFRRKPKPTPRPKNPARPGRRDPMTVTLRPRNERTY